MSFALLVKNEIAKLEASDAENMAELSALIRMNGTLTLSSRGLAVEISTENAAIARRVYSLIKNKYHISSELAARRRMKLKKNNVYIVRINDKVNEILEDLSILGENGFTSAPKVFIVDDIETKRAYLRGAFLGKGSVNDPKTSNYHLELIINDYDHAEFIRNILSELDISGKILERKRGYIVYIKEAEKISDFLRVIGANNGVLYFENIRIYRDHKNMTNRLNNAEQANIEKSMKAANEQIEAIRLIEEKLGFDVLDPKLKIVAEYRIKYEDVSLAELSEIISHETEEVISKSGINHRMRKLKEMASKINE